VKKAYLAVLVVCILMPLSLFITSPIQPVEWTPDPLAQLTGDFEKNTRLDTVRLLLEGQLAEPEDIAFDSQGWLYTGLKDGRIVKFAPQIPDSLITIANTGGRPLGLRFSPNGYLIVADAAKGLLEITLEGEIRTLVTEYQGVNLRLIDHVDVAKNGDIYFSDATARFGLDDHILDFIEATATGRIFKYSALTQQTSLIIEGVFFANGVALGPNDDYLLIAETGKSRVLKHMLTGPDTGKTSVFIDQLPAMPDNIYFDEDDTFWVGLVAMRDWRVESLASYPALRKIMGGIPVQMIKPAKGYGFVMGVNTNGEVTHNYQTESAYTTITSAVRHDGKLYLGSLFEDGVAVFDLE